MRFRPIPLRCVCTIKTNRRNIAFAPLDFHCAIMAPPPNPFQTFTALNEELASLVETLPTSVPSAKAKSRIVTVFTSIPVPKNPLELWEVFDRQFNALFGEDLRDVKTKRLPNIQRGKHGLDLVLTYIRDMVAAGTLDWGAAVPKMQRLVDELKAVK